MCKSLVHVPRESQLHGLLHCRVTLNLSLRCTAR
jgi:hypothetical protein